MIRITRMVVFAGLSSLACSEDTKGPTGDAGSGGGAAESGGAHSAGGATSSGGATTGGASNTGGKAAGSGGKGGGSGGTVTGSGGKATGTGGRAAGGSGGRSSGGASGSAGKGGSGGSTEPPDAGGPDASTACITYCECMAMNCADQVFPGGCLHDCAAGTKWDLACRQGMCSVAPAQPANNHCLHAFGVNECLDKP